jgi:hypothetical protein
LIPTTRQPQREKVGTITSSGDFEPMTLPHQIEELIRDLSPELDICYVSTVPPRRCGIAAFTGDLAGAVSGVSGERSYTLVALIDSPDGAYYSPDVGFSIRQKVIRDYSRAAAYINRSSAHVVNLHHEFGIFGGSGGSYVSVLLKCLEKPVVTTCHTIIETPPAEIRNVFETVL